MTADQETQPNAHTGSKFEASADNLLGMISIDIVAERAPANLQVRDNASSRLSKIIAAKHATTGHPASGSIGYSSTKALQQDLEIAAIETAPDGLRNYHSNARVALQESNLWAACARIQRRTFSASKKFKFNASRREGIA